MAGDWVVQMVDCWVDATAVRKENHWVASTVCLKAALMAVLTAVM
jgi:hypothetical protein